MPRSAFEIEPYEWYFNMVRPSRQISMAWTLYVPSSTHFFSDSPLFQNLGLKLVPLAERGKGLILCNLIKLLLIFIFIITLIITFINTLKIRKIMIIWHVFVILFSLLICARNEIAFRAWITRAKLIFVCMNPSRTESCGLFCNP